MEIDQSWDFNAPQFVDFDNANDYLPGDDEAESYFDFDHENGIPVNFDTSAGNGDEIFKTPVIVEAEFSRTTRSAVKKAKENATPVRNTRPKTPKAIIEEISKENVTPKSKNIPMRKSLSTSKLPDKKAAADVPNNLCKNLSDWKKKSVGSSVENLHAGKQEQEKKGVKRSNRSLERSHSVVKKKKEDFVGKPLQRANSLKRAPSTDRTDPEKIKPLTRPTTPTCLKRKAVTTQLSLKKSEDLELEKIAQYRQELAKKKKMASESYKLAMQGKAPAVQNHATKVTATQEFHFATDSRLKTHGMETRMDCDVKDFASVLRSNKDKKPVTGPVKAGPTKAEPFHFSSQRKRKLPDLEREQAKKYETMAEKLAHFNSTPERFRSKPKAAGPQARGRSRSPPNQGLTVPRTPQFETRTRSRPVTAPTREQMEDKEVEELKRHQFKANPVNQRIFSNPNLGVKKVPRKPPTVPEGFQLSGDRKALDRDEGRDKDEHFEFHAQPVNKKILERVVGVKEARKIAPTIPESPAFALKHRARVPSVNSSVKEEKPGNSRLRSMPYFGVPFQPQYQHKATEPTPFGFDERDKVKAEMKAQKIEQVYEEEARKREFHAKPIPDLEPNLPPKQKKESTIQQPFNLGTQTRGMRKAEEWSHKLEEELRQQKDKVRFKAREPHVLDNEPFIPEKSHKHTKEFSEFELSTAKRTVKREAFEMYKKAKQDQVDNMRKQEDRMKDAEELAELERLRHEAVPKAQPIRHYKPVVVQCSNKPLTEAMSPQFKTDQRLRLRAHLSESANSFASS